MGKPHWIIDSKILGVKTGKGEKVIPKAEEIYSAVFENRRIKGFPDFSASDTMAIKKLSFSRYPADVRINLVVNKAGRLGCEITAESEGKDRTAVNLKKDTADHIIIGNTWYPFPHGRLEEIRKLLGDAAVQRPGKITLKQFLFLRKDAASSYLLKDLTGDLSSAESISRCAVVPVASGFTGKLYPYQKNGLRWLSFIFREQIGGILADEMGLGKTVQVIALLTVEQKEKICPALIVAPATLLRNWERELQKFAPSLKVLVHSGSGRTGFPSVLKSYDVVVGSYDTVLRDLSMVRQVPWKLVIADEAQALKNPYAERAVGIKRLPRKVSLALTGTPVENSLIDLWSIADFIIPDMLGKLEDFRKNYPDDTLGAAALEPLVSPLILRRRVKEVATDLPPRIDIPQILEMDTAEAMEYEHLRTMTLEQYGAAAGIVSLIRLRQFCTHPFLLSGQRSDPALGSAKYRRLTEILEEIFLNSEKVLIFSSFQGMVDIFIKDLTSRYDIYLNYIDGRIPPSQRQNIIDDFTKAEAPGVLILNPKTGGVGLNIVAATHVIHYNLEWNPAVEDQASARVHRRGQERPVTVHRLFYSDTVEDIINARLIRKRGVAGKAVVGTDGTKVEQEYVDITRALSLSPIHTGGIHER
jgi:SNF2 family DNA or RNA helicase